MRPKRKQDKVAPSSSHAETAPHDSCTRSINIEEGLESRRPRSFSMNDTSSPVTRSICGAVATSSEQDEAHVDPLVGSHNSHSCTGRPAVNEVAQFDERASARGFTRSASGKFSAISLALRLVCVYVRSRR